MCLQRKPFLGKEASAKKKTVEKKKPEGGEERGMELDGGSAAIKGGGSGERGMVCSGKEQHPRPEEKAALWGSRGARWTCCVPWCERSAKTPQEVWGVL